MGVKVCLPERGGGGGVPEQEESGGWGRVSGHPGESLSHKMLYNRPPLSALPISTEICGFTFNLRRLSGVNPRFSGLLTTDPTLQAQPRVNTEGKGVGRGPKRRHRARLGRE